MITNKKTIETINRLRVTLSSLREIIIGLYITPSGDIELVVEEDEHEFGTITIGNLLNTSINIYNKIGRKIVYFDILGEKYPNLKEAIKDPEVFNNWFHRRGLSK